MKQLSFRHFVLFVALLLITATSAFAQQKLISSRHYFGVEAGVNYTWTTGANNFFIIYEHPFTDQGFTAQQLLMPLTSLGSGLGGLFGVTLDLSLSDLIAIQAKAHYRAHSMSITETGAMPCTDANNVVGTAQVENHLATSLGFLGLDALLRIQFVPESWYGNIGLGFSNLLSGSQEGYRDITSSTNDCRWQFTPSGDSASLHAPIAKTDAKNLFNASQLHIKLGVGTFIPIGDKGWVLTPELQVAIPLSEMYTQTEVDAYKIFTATPPKMWYAALSIALKFPFGSSTVEPEEKEAEHTTTPSNPPDKKSGKTNLHGRVTNERTGEPVSNANITVIDLGTNEAVADTRTDSEGKYSVEVDAPGKYSVTADEDGYLFGTAYFVVDPNGNISVGKGDIKLSEANGGKVRLLIFFDFDKAELQRSSYPELDRAVRFMKANPNVEVEIAGYTDSKGTDEYNHDLSHRRANAVTSYLTSKGIKSDRLTSKGYGKDNPVATNDTEEGRAENRRVEFVVKKR